MKKGIRYAGPVAAAFIFLLFYSLGETLPHSADYFVRLLQIKNNLSLQLLSGGILLFLNYIESFLLLLWPPAAAAVMIGLGCMASKKMTTGILFGLMLTLIYMFGHWHGMIQTLSLVIGTLLVCLVIAVPAGFILAASRRLNAAAAPVLRTLEAMPAFVYLIPAIVLFPYGDAAAFVAAAISSVVPLTEFTSRAILSVDPHMRETARAFGASRLQSIFKVELPQALPTILSGIHRSAMIAVSMAVTGALVGAKGLGQELLASLTVLNVSLSLLCGISITFVAIMTNRLFLDLVARSEEKRLRRF